MTPKQSAALPKEQTASSAGSSSKRPRRRRPAASEVAVDPASEEEREESAAHQGSGKAGKRQRDLQKDSRTEADVDPILSPVDGKRGRKRHSDRGGAVTTGGESETEVVAPHSAKAKKKKNEASEKEGTSLTVKIRLTDQLKSTREKGQVTPLKEGSKKRPQDTAGLGEFLMNIYDAVLSKQVGEVQGTLRTLTLTTCYVYCTTDS